MSQLSVYEFGKILLDTNDLDPLYLALWEAKLPKPKLCKWLLCFFNFYHSGTSSWIVDQPDYWKAMRLAASSKEWPRCHERRHFRGENARKAVEFQERKGIEALFTPLLANDLAAEELIDYVKTWVGYGPWIAFKVADMVERLNLSRVSFRNSFSFVYDSPAKAATILYKCEYGEDKVIPSNVVSIAVESILERLGDTLAPPRYERKINLQECETILCKHGSYLKGHYELGEDVMGLRKGLLRFAKCKTSQQLLAAGKRGGLW
jgi:hypothetical protein